MELQITIPILIVVTMSAQTLGGLAVPTSRLQSVNSEAKQNEPSVNLTSGHPRVTPGACYQMHKLQKPTGHSERGIQRTIAQLRQRIFHKEKNDQTLGLASPVQRILHSAMTAERSVSLVKTPVHCPEGDIPYPCSCDSLNAVIDCSATGNFTLIRTFFNSVPFRDTRFIKFLMVDNGGVADKETTLLNNTFGPVSFEEIIIKNTHLQTVGDVAFQGSEQTLQKIQLEHNNNLRTFPFQTLHEFKALSELNLAFGKISWIPSLNFLPNLQSLLLNNNVIYGMDSRAFASLPSLLTLDLGINYLGTIGSHALHFSSPDVFLYLDDNRISNIEDDAFSNKQPVSLDISSNQMSTLNATVFKPIVQNIIDEQSSYTVDARQNPVCCEGIEWILNNPTYSEHFLLPNVKCTYP